MSKSKIGTYFSEEAAQRALNRLPPEKRARFKIVDVKLSRKNMWKPSYNIVPITNEKVEGENYDSILL